MRRGVRRILLIFLISAAGRGINAQELGWTPGGHMESHLKAGGYV